jgi:medium-chain acyl-[acyl-carrier-protein] hydrolase
MSSASRSSSGNLWLPFQKGPSAARRRLFCFPFAGGTASIYRKWLSEFPADVEVVPVQLPGRERRMREPAFRDLDPLLDVLVDVLQPEFDRPFAFFGHSMGAIIAYGLGRRLQEIGARGPSHLFVSARVAAHLVPREEPIHAMERPQFVAALKAMGGTPPEVLDHKELMDMMEPLLRADLGLNEAYQYRDGPLLQCPITAFCGAQDQEAKEGRMRQWEDLTTGAFRFHLFPQGHFFLEQARTELIQEICNDLER